MENENNTQWVESNVVRRESNAVGRVQHRAPHTDMLKPQGADSRPQRHGAAAVHREFSSLLSEERLALEWAALYRKTSGRRARLAGRCDLSAGSAGSCCACVADLEAAPPRTGPLGEFLTLLDALAMVGLNTWRIARGALARQFIMVCSVRVFLDGGPFQESDIFIPSPTLRADDGWASCYLFLIVDTTEAVDHIEHVHWAWHTRQLLLEQAPHV